MIFIGGITNIRQDNRYKTFKSVTNNMIDNGADFYILELENDLDKRLELEKYYIISYIKQGYDVLNYRNNKNNKECRAKKNKTIYKQIKVNVDDYNNLIELMDNNDIDYKIK